MSAVAPLWDEVSGVAGGVVFALYCCAFHIAASHLDCAVAERLNTARQIVSQVTVVQMGSQASRSSGYPQALAHDCLILAAGDACYRNCVHKLRLMTTALSNFDISRVLLVINLYEREQSNCARVSFNLPGSFVHPVRT